MKEVAYALAALLSSTLIAPPSSAAPVVVGLDNRHPLTEVEAGDLLLGELKCLACHSRKTVPQPLERTAPDLAEVGSRAAPEYLKRFIASPSKAHRGSTMPDVLSGETEVRRSEIAEAISHFLVAQSSKQFQVEAISDREASSGKMLFHSVGCIACHSPRDEAGKETTVDGVIELGHIPAKYSLASLGEFLFQPMRVRASGRMPDMKLTPAEARSMASYLIGKASPVSTPLKPQDGLANLGKKYFQQLNCAACHKFGDVAPAAIVGELQDSNSLRGCLAKTPGKNPQFNLSDEQIHAIRATLAKRPEPASDKTLLAKTLTAFNCIACHNRDDYGGVSEERNLLFQSTAKNLGDDGRIPPPLTLVGAKLQPVWLKKVLFDSDSVRPYMLTRMPQYGEPNLHQLPELLSRLDKVGNFEFSLPNSESDHDKERQRAKQLRDAGRELIGDKGLNCIACHSFNGKTPSSEIQGIDLATSFQRLKPNWFYHFMQDPGAFRKRTIMPTSWPGGVAVQKTILNGDSTRQLEAIWYFLSLGTSAPDPSGLRSIETKLMVTDTTRTYRGRSSVAGFRGIAVGFPEKLNYAFNAETGTLTAIWRGDYVRVDRSGQGSGAFNPASKFIPLAQDVSFFALPDERTPWPLRPVTTKEQPVNPDPLYPKNRGYQFKGYYLDDASIPTFMYRSGDIEIEDRSNAETSENNSRLVRKLAFDSPKAQTVWFRLLTGKVEAESKLQFKNPELRLSIPSVQTLVRPNSSDKNTSELLLKLEIPQGKSQISLTYELLK